MSDNDNDIVTEEEGEELEMKLMQWLIHEHKVCIRIPGLEIGFKGTNIGWGPMVTGTVKGR
jgi:hypothetical protein